MRIDPNSEIGGYPAIRVRAFLRRYLNINFSLISVCNFMKTSNEDAKRFVAALEAAGLIERVERGNRWRCSQDGHRMSMASAAKPIRRATADRLLSELLDRVLTVNRDDDYLFRVARVAVFGSYLTNTDQLSDVDIGIEFVRRVDDSSKFRALSDARTDAAMERGWRPRDMVEMVFYPQQEICTFLRGRSRAIALHDYSHLSELDTPYRDVYTASDET